MNLYPKACFLKLGVALTLAGAALGCQRDADSWAESQAASTAAEHAVEAVASAQQAAPAESAKPLSARADAEPERPSPPVVNVDAPLSVKRLVVAHGVDQREPLEPSASFAASETERVYAFVEVLNPERANSEIHVSFSKVGAPENGGIRLRVGESPRWRTWAYTRLAKEPGAWQVVVRDGRGNELSRASFEITADGDGPAA